MTFTEDRANVGVQLEDAPMFAPPETAPFAAQIDPGSGAISGGTLDVPQFATHITTPIDADVTVDFAIGTIGGSFDEATGALTLEGTAGGTLTSKGEVSKGEECIVSTDPAVLVVSTAGNSGGASSRSGTPFTSVSGIHGPGSIAGQWSDMHATPVHEGDAENVTFCKNVEKRIGGEGGIWLEQEGVVVSPRPPDHPERPACVVPDVTGKRLKAARRIVRAAGCKVHKVWKPKWVKGRMRRHLVVKWSSPKPGATPADGKVNLGLGLKHRPHHRMHRRAHHHRAHR